jgi:hypothetical protein
MIICFEIVFNRVLSNSKTHLIVKSETFHIYAERARDSVGVVARFARPLTIVLVRLSCGSSSFAKVTDELLNSRTVVALRRMGD